MANLETPSDVFRRLGDTRTESLIFMALDAEAEGVRPVAVSA